MSNIVDQEALDKFIKKCDEAMSNLIRALEIGDVRVAKSFLSQAEILRDGLESKMPPQNRSSGADFLKTKGLLDDAIVTASFKLDSLGTDMGYPTSASRGISFGGGASCHESVHVDDFDFHQSEF